MSCRVLVVDDEESIRFTFSAFLGDSGYTVETSESLRDALDKIAAQSFDVIFLDILLGRESGIIALKASRESQPNTPVIMVTGAPEISTATEAVRLGAFDYITKPLHQDELLRQAKLAVEHKALVDKQESYQLRMAAVFQSVNEGIMVFDEEMKLAEINDAAVKMLSCGVSLKGLSPKEISAHCPPLGILREMIEERCEGDIFRLESKTGAGNPLVLGLTMAPLTGCGGRELGTVLVLRDESMPTKRVAS
jgi:two-component system response regulator HydG